MPQWDLPDRTAILDATRHLFSRPLATLERGEGLLPRARAGTGPVRGGRRPLTRSGEVAYARFAAGATWGMTGVHARLPSGDALVWWGEGPLGRYGHALGDPSAVEATVRGLRGDGALDGLGWLNWPVPPAPDPYLPDGWTVRERWDYVFLPGPGELVTPPGAQAVRPVVDVDEINALLEVAFPHGELRPGHPLVNAWYGAYADGALVACAADRSFASPDLDAVPTGVIGGVAVHPEHRRQGWGAAVTAAVAVQLLASYDQVGLGVTAGNETAARVYERLGFTGRHRLLSAQPHPSVDHGRTVLV